MTLGLAGLFGLFDDDEVDRARRRVDSVPVVPAEDLAEGVAAVEGTVRRHRQSLDPPLEGGEVVASLEADDDARAVVDRARLSSVEDREVLADEAAEEAPGGHAGDPANVRETAGGDATDAPIEGATVDETAGDDGHTSPGAVDGSREDPDDPAADGSGGEASGSRNGAPEENAAPAGDVTEAGDRTDADDPEEDLSDDVDDHDDRPPVVTRYRRLRRNGADRIADAELVEDRFEAVPFVLEDETGSVLVDPRDAVDADSLLVSAGNTDRYFGDEAGDRLAELRTDDLGAFEGLTEVRMALGESPEWIHLQSTLRPGDRAYVLGPVTETPGGSPPYAVAPDEDDPFLLSDMGRSALLEQLTRQTSPVDRRALLFVVLGLALVVAVVLVVGVAVDWVV